LKNSLPMGHSRVAQVPNLLYRRFPIGSAPETRSRCAVAAALLLWTVQGTAVVLWSDLGATLAHETGPGSDMLGEAVRRDDAATDTLYFKFHVDPLSDVGTEEYFAAFQLYEGDQPRLAVGNTPKAWAYSAFNTAQTGPSNNVAGDFDLNSARPESPSAGVYFSYELPHRGYDRTIVFKVEYVAGGDDRVTVWLNPDLTPGASEASQPESLTTRFTANASFNQIRLRHGGGGGGWTFSDMAVATSFEDFVAEANAEPGRGTNGFGSGAQQLTFRSWQREQGLPQTSVRALAQTRDGYLWVGSEDGVARFDGVRFVSFGLREGLRSGSVRVLFEDSHGVLWIGTAAGGLTSWREGQFATFTTLDGLPANSITALAEDPEGRLWVGTETGLAVRQNARFEPATAGDFKGKHITTLSEDRHGAMWVGVASVGVFRWTEGKFVPLTDASVDSLLKDSHCLLEDNVGRIWVGAGDDVVLCREGNQWHRYRIPRHLARPYIGALAQEPDGTVWAGSVSEGLFRFKEGRLTAINASSGLSDNSVESLLVDREGNLWVGTGGGLTRVRRSTLSVFGQNEGLGYGPVQGLAEIAPNVIWAGKPSDGLYVWNGRSFSRLLAANLIPGQTEGITLLKARDGSCWVGGGRGFWHFDDPKAADAGTEISALSGLNVMCLTETADKGVWAGTREGEIWREAHGTWVRETNYAQSYPITAMVEDAQGAMWIGTEGGGLYRFRGGGRTRFAKGGRLLSDWIRTLHLDAQGALWIGTAGGGLSRWRAEELATFTTREGLPDNTISQILEDDAGRLWLGSNRGIACVRKIELEELTAGKVAAVYPQVYGRAEGMPSEECTGGFFPAGLKTESGRLCFSTLKGIVVADPHTRTADTPAPPVVLEEMLIDGVPAESKPAGGAVQSDALKGPDLTCTNQLVVPPGKHRLELRYTGIGLTAPERVRFRYQLEGLDLDWVEAGARRTAFYNYVPPGTYQFRVIACASSGAWNEAGASLFLVVLPHFWQARWFIVLTGVGVLGSVGGVVRIVERRKNQRRLKQMEQERALELERARIARDLHDDLGSSLTRISLLCDLAKADKDSPSLVETHAQKISQSAGQTVRALEEIVWALRPGSDSLQSLVEYITHFATELFEGDTTHCRLDLPQEIPSKALPPEMRHNIFLIVKEALTNALKHAQAREVHLAVRASPTTLEIRVQDDGCGSAPEVPKAKGRGQGLGNMRQRAGAMGGTLKVESTVGKGTTITLTITLPRGA
jgi:ligand-binding sensor domain-containing protein/signal transduction histidine kinase